MSFKYLAVIFKGLNMTISQYEPISIFGYRLSSIALFMVTQTHFQWWFLGSKWIVKKLPYFYEIYQPLKKGHTIFEIPRSLELFLMDFVQKSFS